MEAVVLGELRQNAASQLVSRYDIEHVEMYGSARKHGVDDADIDHAVHHAVVVADQDDGKVLYLGPDRATNFLEVVAVRRHVPVRLDPELRKALDDRAIEEHTTASDIVREALRRYLRAG